MDRDLNTAKNIQAAESTPETPNAHGATVKQNHPSERVTLDSMKREPSARRPSAASLGTGDHKRGGALQTTVRQFATEDDALPAKFPRTQTRTVRLHHEHKQRKNRLAGKKT